MKISVVLAHPDPSSFNHAIAQRSVTALEKIGCEVFYHDLYSEGFDPLLPTEEIPKNAVVPPLVEQHCREATLVNGFIIVHPNWWGMPPAILAGWVDRVMRPGVAYEFLEDDSGEGVPHGLLPADKAIVFNTSNTESEREKTVFKDPLETIWKNCVFDLCGVTEFRRTMFNIVVTSSLQQRVEWLEQVEESVVTLFG